MNYAMARERSDKPGWAFTVQNDDDVWTAQCCRAEPEHHRHPTKEAAVECFNSWRRDPAGVKLDDQHYGDWTSCAVCGEPTKAAATHQDIGSVHRGVALCPEHMTVENVVSQIEDCAQVTYS